MERPFRRNPAVSLLFLTALIAACETTRTTAEWRNQDYTGGPIDNVLITGVSDQEAVRRSFEDAFVTRLENENVRALSSAAVMPAGERVTRQSLEPVIASERIDMVLVTHLVGVEHEEVYDPPLYTPLPYYGGFYGYYGHVSNYVYEPGYYTRHELVKLETSLYDARNGGLVWSMQSETLDPASERKLIEAKIDVVIERLKAQKLL